MNRSVLLWLIFVAVVSMAAIAGCAIKRNYKSYEGYVLLNLEVNDEAAVQHLLDLEENMPALDFWDYPVVHQNASLLVPPELLDTVNRRLRAGNIASSVLNDDIDSLIAAGSRRGHHPRVKKSMDPSQFVIDHESYHDYNKIVDYTGLLQSVYPGQVTLTNLSLQTYEGRSIQLVKLHGSSLSPGDEERPLVLLESGIHAREWIAPAASLYIMDRLLHDYKKGTPDSKKVLDTYDVYVIPVLNPDGYVFTHNEDRLWRKNRHPFKERKCVGVDLNRNFDVKFGTARTFCFKNSYPGDYAFSERETMAFKHLFDQVGKRIQAYVSLHANGQFLLRPWAYTSNDTEPENGGELNRIGKNVLAAIRNTHGTRYDFGTAYQLLSYTASGTSLDWTQKTKPWIISLTFELRPSRHDRLRWLLPEKEIEPTGEEVYNGLVELVHSMTDRRRNRTA